MARFVIQLNEANGIQREDGFDYIPALIAAARDIQELNQYVGYITDFDRPISCNPEAVWWVEATEETPAHWEGESHKILSDFCTPPTVEGFVTIDIQNYRWINFRYLVQVPTSFFYIGGEPPQVGKII